MAGRHHYRRGRAMVPSTDLAPLDGPSPRPAGPRPKPPAGDLVLRLRRPALQQTLIFGTAGAMLAALAALWRSPLAVTVPICVVILARAATDRIDVTTTAVVVRGLLGTDEIALADVSAVIPDPFGRHPRGFYLECTDGSQFSAPSVRAGSLTGQRRTAELLEATIDRLRPPAGSVLASSAQPAAGPEPAAG